MCATLPTAMCCANVSNFNILDAKGSVHYESKDTATDFQMNTFPHFYILKTDPSALYIFQIYIARLKNVFVKNKCHHIIFHCKKIHKIDIRIYIKKKIILKTKYNYLLKTNITFHVIFLPPPLFF